MRKGRNAAPAGAANASAMPKAAAEVLGQHGLDGTTIPRIAQHAGLTPGSVYRRFKDKDALLETVILGILERQEERARTRMTPEMSGRIPLPVLAEQIIHGMVVGYRANAPLLRALRQFVQGKAHTPFWRKASRLEARAYQRIVELILANRQDIRHPDPPAAVSLGLMMVISTLYELVVAHQDMKTWKAFLPKNDLALKRELTRAFLSYLDVAPARSIRADTVDSR